MKSQRNDKDIVLESLKYFYYVAVPVLIIGLIIVLFKIQGELSKLKQASSVEQPKKPTNKMPINIDEIPDTVMFGSYIISVDLIRDKVYEMIHHYVNHSEKLLEIKRFEKEYKYIPYIIEAAGLHKYFWVLAWNESLLDPNARSRAGAVGMFQFARRTARRYGLRVDRDYIDDRREPIRAARAFVKYLKKLIRDFDDDIALALAAYNRGPTAMNRLIRKSGIEDYYSLDGNSMPRETKYYLPGIIALKLLAKTEYYKKLPIVSKAQPIPWIEVAVHPRKTMHISVINDSLRDDSFMNLNHQFISYRIPRRKQVIVVPAEHQTWLEKYFKKHGSYWKLNIELPKNPG